MILHQISHENLNELENIFAYYTRWGWKIPEWLILLRKTVRNEQSGKYVSE